MKKLTHIFIALLIAFSFSCKKEDTGTTANQTPTSIYSVQYVAQANCEASYRDATGNIISGHFAGGMDKTFTNLPCGFNAYFQVMANTDGLTYYTLRTKISASSSTVEDRRSLQTKYSTYTFNKQLFCK